VSSSYPVDYDVTPFHSDWLKRKRIQLPIITPFGQGSYSSSAVTSSFLKTGAKPPRHRSRGEQGDPFLRLRFGSVNEALRHKKLIPPFSCADEVNQAILVPEVCSPSCCQKITSPWSKHKKEQAMSIRIILVDDHKIMLEGLVSLIEKQPDLEVVAQAEDGQQAIKLARELSPDVIIMDVNMPGLGGIDATRQILAENPLVKILALSGHSSRQFVVEMIDAGACGYVLKQASFSDLLETIRAVAAGRYENTRTTGIILDKSLRKDNLTDRERQVLRLVAEGKSSKETALRLSLSVKTVETHRRQLMNKLKIFSVAELTRYAVREGLIPLDA
jgi:DNA-binding NarL/FixJ family response regulator